MSEPFELRAGVRVFIVKPRDDVPIALADEGPIFERHFRATITSQHSKDRWWAETDAGERILLSKADVVALRDTDNDTMWGTLLIGTGVATILGAIWLVMG